MASPSPLAALRGNAVLARATRPADRPQAANQNGAPVVSDDVLDAALRHFAEFGLGAAREALIRAEAAMVDSDEARAAKWLEIARALDRRMAARFERDRQELRENA